MPSSDSSHSDFLGHVAARAADAGVFLSIEADSRRVQCAAKASSSPAWYRVDFQDHRPFVSLVTADRYLSQSIELDLVHTGDTLDDLLEEELIELGYDEGTLRVEHFRSEDKLFTFRSRLPIESTSLTSPKSIDVASQCLLAYEACFRRLGDMAAQDEDE